MPFNLAIVFLCTHIINSFTNTKGEPYKNISRHSFSKSKSGSAILVGWVKLTSFTPLSQVTPLGGLLASLPNQLAIDVPGKAADDPTCRLLHACERPAAFQAQP